MGTRERVYGILGKCTSGKHKAHKEQLVVVLVEGREYASAACGVRDERERRDKENGDGGAWKMTW